MDTRAHNNDNSYIFNTYRTVGFIKTLTENIRAAIGEPFTTVIYTATLAVLHILLLIITNYLFLLICIVKEKAHYAIKKALTKKN